LIQTNIDEKKIAGGNIKIVDVIATIILEYKLTFKNNHFVLRVSA